MDFLYKEILTIDEKLLLFINGLHSSFGDIIMWHFSDRFFWIPLYVLLLDLTIRKIGPKKAMLFIIILALMIFTTDQLGASILRPNIGRLRPSSSMNPISSMLYFVNDYRGGNFGFPSCHAANTFALVIYLSSILKSAWVKFILFTWAILVSCSRVYLGVHYPTDIFAGATLGICIGYNFILIYRFVTDIRIPLLDSLFSK